MISGLLRVGVYTAVRRVAEAGYFMSSTDIVRQSERNYSELLFDAAGC